MKEDLKATKSHLAFLKSQHQHEVRKKGKELDRMKNRLLKLVNEKTQVGKIGMKCINPLPKAASTIMSQTKKENPVGFNSDALLSTLKLITRLH
jgi:hypothetical protein